MTAASPPKSKKVKKTKKSENSTVNFEYGRVSISLGASNAAINNSNKKSRPNNSLFKFKVAYIKHRAPKQITVNLKKDGFFCGVIKGDKIRKSVNFYLKGVWRDKSL